MKTHDLARTRTVLKVHPPALFEASDHPPRKSPDRGSLVVVFSAVRGRRRLDCCRRHLDARDDGVALAGHVLVREGLKVLAPLAPGARVADRCLCNVDGCGTCHNERLALEFIAIELRENLPIELRVRIAEWAEDAARHPFEQRWGRFGHARATISERRGVLKGIHREAGDSLRVPCIDVQGHGGLGYPSD